MAYTKEDAGHEKSFQSYQSRVTSLCRRYPHLRNLSDFFEKGTRHNLGRIAALEILQNNTAPTHRKLKLSQIIDYLDSHQESSHVIIVEDLTKELIEILGSALDIDPAFFARHIYISRSEEGTWGGQSSVLPSVINQERFNTINFFTTITLESTDKHASTRKLLCCSNVRRKVGVIAPPSTEGDPQLGVVSRSCSVLKISRSYNTWLCIILVDPPFGNSFVSEDTSPRDKVSANYFPTRLFGGGYVDFGTPSEVAIRVEQSDSGPSRNSMLDDLVHYWTRGLPPVFDVVDPDLLSLSYYPLKIAAAEWMSFVNSMNLSLGSYKYSLHRNSDFDLEALESYFRYLQSWKRRITRSLDKLTEVQDAIQPLQHRKPCESWEAVENDYKFLIGKVERLDRQLDPIFSIIASLLQLFENRRSSEQTVSMTRLSYLALFFVPLTFVTGLFSMSGDFAPGSAQFWLFFAVAIPALLITFGVGVYSWWFPHLRKAILI